MFSCEGKYKEFITTNTSKPINIFPSESAEFLKNINEINKLLIEKGISRVTNMKIISPTYGLVFLYIETNRDEYFIKLHGDDNYYFIMPEIDSYKLYTVNEILNTIENIPENIQRLRVNVLAEKPTYQTETEQLQNMGLLKGNDNGLDLLKPLTRAEAATMLLRAMGVSESAENISRQTFSDVSATHWAYGAVEKASNMGLVNGMGDGIFAPDSLVTSVQFATMVLRAADEPEFDWQLAEDMLVEKGVITEEETQTMDFFTRGDMAKIIYEAIENELF